MIPISICTSEDPAHAKMQVLMDKPELTLVLKDVKPEQWVKVSRQRRESIPQPGSGRLSSPLTYIIIFLVNTLYDKETSLSCRFYQYLMPLFFQYYAMSQPRQQPCGVAASFIYFPARILPARLHMHYISLSFPQKSVSSIAKCDFGRKLAVCVLLCEKVAENCNGGAEFGLMVQLVPPVDLDQ